MKEKAIHTPVSNSQLNRLQAGDLILISGLIYAGRDAVLPKLKSLFEQSALNKNRINLKNSVIFHTAVSPAGIGPTSSNKYDIENSIPTLSKAGVKIHIGKGILQKATIDSLHRHESIYAVTPPLSALLAESVISSSVVAFPEEGIEALYMLKVEKFPAIVCAIRGQSMS